jgi:hypothetical protein
MLRAAVVSGPDRESCQEVMGEVHARRDAGSILPSLFLYRGSRRRCQNGIEIGAREFG